MNRFFCLSLPSAWNRAGRYCVEVACRFMNSNFSSWNTSMLDLTLSPSPDQLALDNGMASTAPLNQYLINEGILPTSITVTSSDTTFTEYLRVNSWWNLIGTAPALRPLLPNFKEENYGVATVGPQHPAFVPPVTGTPVPNATPTPTPTPQKGLKFDLSSFSADGSAFSFHWPVDNTKFGVKTLNHVISGTSIPAPVAFFYPWNGIEHPPNPALKGYWHNATGSRVDVSTPASVPNWVYYYDQAWKNPWGIPTSFWEANSSYSTTNSTGEHMYVGYDTHGSNTQVTQGDGKIETDLFAFVPGLIGLRWVGSESTRGIDVYKRVISHECTHLLINRMRKARDPQTNALLYPDNDPDLNGYPVGDKLPDVLETYVSESSRGNGLSPLIRDTTGWATAYNPVEYNDYPDEEVFCRMTERGLFGPLSEDWANDGLNYGRPVPPNRLQRTAPHYPAGYNGSSLTFPSPGSVPVLPAPTPIPTPTPTPGGTP